MLRLQRGHLDDERLQLRRDVVAQVDEIANTLGEGLQRGHVTAAPDPPCADQLRHHHAEREDVGATVDVRAEGLLRRHVPRLALAAPGPLGELGARFVTGDTKVRELHPTLPGHQDVLR